MSDVIGKLSVECGLLKARTLELQAENAALKAAGDALENASYDYLMADIAIKYLYADKLDEARANYREARGE